MINDGGTYFFNKPLESLMKKYAITHKVATPYHPQTSEEVELASRKIKQILLKHLLVKGVPENHLNTLR